MKTCAEKILGLTLVFLSLASLSCSKKSGQREEELPIPVKYAVVEERSFQDELVTYGSVSFSSKNDIAATVEGTLRDLRHREGAYVAKGAILAVLDNIQLSLEREKVLNEIKSAEANIALVKANLRDAELSVETRILSRDRKIIEIRQKEIEIEEAKSSLKKKGELYEVGGLSEESYKGLLLSLASMETDLELMKKDLEIQSIGLRDEDIQGAGIGLESGEDKRIAALVRVNTEGIRSQLTAAEVALLNAKKNLESTDRLLDALVLRSPMSGYVGATYFEKGEYIEKNAKVLTMIEVSAVDAVFHVQESDVAILRQGMAVDLSVESSGTSIRAKISEVSPMADPQTGNFTVKARFPNPNNTLRPGMFLRIRLQRKEHPLMPVLPASCVVDRQGNTGRVFEILDGKAVAREIRIERESNGELWLAQGPKKGRPVINTPSSAIREGTYVTTSQ